MRTIIALLIVIVTATFAAGYLSLSYRLQPDKNPDVSEIIHIRKAFAERIQPVFELDLTQKYLLDPSLNLPQTSKSPYQEISALYAYSKTCVKENRSHRNLELRKAWIWQDFICGNLAALPKDFFMQKPWIHPSGSSYAFLAFQLGKAPFTDPDWLKSHIHLMHALEFSRLPEDLLTRDQKALSLLNRSALGAITSGAPIAISNHLIFLERNSLAPRDAANGTYYEGYSWQAFQNFLKNSPVTVEVLRPGISCLLQEGNACWNYNYARLYAKTRVPSLILTALTLALAGVVAWILVQTLRRQKHQSEQTQFALRTLTHELRTPVADLVLSVDAIRPDFDRLSSSAQDAFMRALSDVQRLTRLTETSKRYLGSKNLETVDSNPIQIPSIKEFLKDFIEDQNTNSLELKEHSEDTPIQVDPDWLSICLRNLVENAVHHGKPPVQISSRIENGQLRISITDQGKLEFQKLDEATAPFRKGSQSQGLGLGLSIVAQIAKVMKGGLEQNSNPTTFTLILPLESQ